jgi:putative phosphoribosyl transferase
MPALYHDRKEAGLRLAEQLTEYSSKHDTIILALPRGGVPVAFAIARQLRLPLDVFVVRPFSAPENSTLAIGVVATGGVRVVDPTVLYELSIPESRVDEIAAYELPRLEATEYLYRQGRPAPDLNDRTVILVDDGLTDAATLKAAVHALRQLQPRAIVLALPGVAPEEVPGLRAEVNRLVLGAEPSNDGGITVSYADHSAVTDNDVRSLLEQAAPADRSTQLGEL